MDDSFCLPLKKLLIHNLVIFQVLPTSSSKNVQYVSSDMVNGFQSNSSKKPLKRPNNAEKSYDVPLEQRLENLSVDIPSTSNAPTSESLVHLLLQVSQLHLTFLSPLLLFFFKSRRIFEESSCKVT